MAGIVAWQPPYGYWRKITATVPFNVTSQLFIAFLLKNLHIIGTAITNPVRKAIP
jgi:hypothetical protein